MFVLTQEAKQLSSLHDVMATHGVGLHAVVHETLGAEEFKAYIKGDVYYDPEVNMNHMVAEPHRDESLSE